MPRSTSLHTPVGGSLISGLFPPLPGELFLYARSPDIVPSNFPEEIGRAHENNEHLWTVLHVMEGQVVYNLLRPARVSALIGPGCSIVIRPGFTHLLAFADAGRFFLEFHLERPPHHLLH